MAGKKALIIGASRGIGLGLARELATRGYRVIATERTHSDELHQATKGAPIEVTRCDVTERADIAALRSLCGDNTLDLLVLNAGVYGSGDQSIAALEREALADILMTNAVGPAQAAAALMPCLKDGGRIGMLTSKMGSIDDSSGGVNYYRLSKVAQNMLARSLFEQHGKARGVSVLSLHPGWVQTDMGGPNALIGIEQSAAGLADRLEETRPPEHVFVDYSGKSIGW